MVNLSEKVANSFRNKSNSKANPANKVTSRRRKLYSVIKDRTGGDPQAELDYSMKIIKKERPKIENYILSKNEVPLDRDEDMIMQAYKLRCNEIDSTANMLGISDGEANIFLEDDEAEVENANNYESENFIGELFAPIGVAAAHLQSNSMQGEADNFIDPALVMGLFNTGGQMIDKGALKRAAQNKKPGILGTLSGGNKEYNMLREYLQNPANKDEKDMVLKGAITETSQLRGYGAAAGTVGRGQGVNILAKDVIDQIAKQKKREAINKALPFIIIGLVVIVVVTVLIVKSANKNK